MTKAIFITSGDATAEAYDSAIRARVQKRAEIIGQITPGHRWREELDLLRRTDVIFTGWGAPLMDREFVCAAPNLKAVFYAGGSVRYFATPALWQRGVRLTTAQTLNAIPVSEYTLSVILLGLKRFWSHARATQTLRTFPPERPVTGAYRSVVGLISYGCIGRLVRKKLRAHDLRVLVYDPFLGPPEARREHVESVSLDELFATADAVSLHAPLLPETTRLIAGRHFEMMKPGAVFINTARGEIVDEPAMIAALARRPDLQAILDVATAEPPDRDSPLYLLPNVVLTPHIAGSLGAECLRMGAAMGDEFERFLDGRPLFWELTTERSVVTA